MTQSRDLTLKIIFFSKIPLTPSDWWWFTKYGMLAIPMSALKRFKWIILAVALTTFGLGGLWHVQEAFRHLFSVDIIEAEIISGSTVWRSKTFVYTIGAILAVPLIWNGEKIVDCFGHSNIFILAFVSFALRFAGLCFDNETSYATLFEILEPISFYLAWLAVFLFIRHLIPKKFLGIGQAIFVILFFALGRGIGFFFGTSIVYEPSKFLVIRSEDELNLLKTTKSNGVNDLKDIHSTAACIACGAALVYFVIYYLILLRSRVPTQRLNTSNNNDSNVSPQRIFHDERAKKGYFRY